MPDKTVLIVDDEKSIRETLSEMLKIFRVKAESVDSGDTAIARIEANPDSYKLVLLDLFMEGMDGEETFEKLHALAPELPIYIVSGYVEGEIVDKLIQKGAMGLLGKPFRLNELKDILGFH